jgi:hypothetical protein
MPFDAPVAWVRLPDHCQLFGSGSAAVMPLAELLRTWHRNRVRRVRSADSGESGPIQGRADEFVGAHGVSFLTVI